MINQKDLLKAVIFDLAEKLMLISIIAIGLSIIGCGQPQNNPPDEAQALLTPIPSDLCGYDQQVTSDDPRPDMFVIGDSISLGWMPQLANKLPNYDVQHNNCNGMNSRNGAARINQWLTARPYWNAIIFNHGLWDATPITSGTNYWFFWTSETEYANNLRLEAKAIKAKTSCAIYLLTTEVPLGNPMNQEVIKRNQIAQQVMDEEGVQVIDLYTVSQSAEHISPSNIHYSDYGSGQLADAILNSANCL